MRLALQDSYSAIEEAKADISGLFAMQYLVDKGVLPKAMERTMYVTFLASAFARSGSASRRRTARGRRCSSTI